MKSVLENVDHGKHATISC